MTLQADLLKSCLRHFAEWPAPPPPPPREALKLAAWIERNVELAEGFVAEAGKMKLWPYQREIADAIADPAYERVTVLKASRVGYTALLVGAIGYWCVEAPGPILVLLPVEADCKDFMTSDIETTFAASPALQAILVDESRVGQRGRPLKGLQRRNTILARRFEQGSLKIVPAKARRNLRRHSARYLVLDECDAMENSGEGDVVALAERRTLSFANRKIILGSTPIDEATSHVCRAYEQSDQRVYEVPCPACKTFSEITWADIEWPPGLPVEAAWRCPACRAAIPAAAKASMVQDGRWRAQRPDVAGHAGFKLSALVSPLANASWGKLAAEFLAAKDDPATLKPFVNTVLAEPWRQQGDEIDEGALASRVERFGLDKLPGKILCITCGTDVQIDRLEITYCGWTRTSGECFVLAHSVLHGPTDAEGLWQDLDDLLKQRWTHPHGGTLGVDAAAIDAGSGGHYDRVMKFAAARAGRRVFAVKGAPGFGRPAFKAAQNLKSRGSQRLYIVGVDSLKLLIFERLKRAGIIHFSDSLDASYFEQLASERLVTKFARGRPSRRFELAPGKRNECLDALTYATAAREGCAIALDAREAALRLEPQSKAAPRVTRSKWLEGL